MMDEWESKKHHLQQIHPHLGHPYPPPTTTTACGSMGPKGLGLLRLALELLPQQPSTPQAEGQPNGWYQTGWGEHSNCPTSGAQTHQGRWTRGCLHVLKLKIRIWSWDGHSIRQCWHLDRQWQSDKWTYSNMSFRRFFPWTVQVAKGFQIIWRGISTGQGCDALAQKVD